MKLLIVVTCMLIGIQIFAHELHIIKNNGMRTHEVFQCADTRACYDLYKTKRHFDSSINCATRMWVERDNKTIMRLKGS